MNAEIIAVGSELLLGQIANTNAQFISRNLAEIGVNVFYHTTVGDNPERLEKAIKHAQTRVDTIIFSGGLGPTKDDLTKETIAKVLGLNLIEDELALVRIRDYFKKVNRAMTDNNRKQAHVLEGSTVFPNDNGMAPGMSVTVDQITYLLLPGPPKEMKPMFDSYVRPFLLNQLHEQTVITSKILHFFGIGEAQLETELEDLIDKQTNPTIAPLASDGEVVIRLTAKAETVENAQALMVETEKEIFARVGDYFYGYDDTSLFHELVKLLKDRSITVASAESLTGGFFGESLTNEKGASTVFSGGMITYSNEAKMNLLGVEESTLIQHGAVSEETAREMAQKVRERYQSNIGISFTGVAGPAEQEGKPVGTVFIGLADAHLTEVHALTLAGSRHSIRLRSVKYGAYYLLKKLLG
ncbi:competence/damage-inducible protein A [Bacillus solimangrovi]|uniref:Putative competence-damage inducible protein n=1 Tax=Bacillus solimangrovi TaxID=1305675 RepID=A0A1E5LJD5_9BACI|nr:competence/damage-inducible protein A [Bacillus solimangrovi]OEH94138.1 competence/damage-inducible protein A [Bacillus solimangrovi]